MYSKNVLNLLTHISNAGQVELKLDDEIVKGSLITYKKEVVNQRVKDLIK